MMTVEEVSKRLGTQDFHVYDANSEKTYAEAHLPGAVHVKFNTFAEEILPTKKDATLVFYCKNEH